ncbi:hypothetical protein EFL81_10040 [Weissella confusa]|uniref:hypothetical protein n=1 Tax=Weissella confusa TaxID=1583 RepID=UPI00223C4E82|nr:hypothetical protein [Weissella confusa]MCS9997151.1 hypothetical protein [Weissella confusa]
MREKIGESVGVLLSILVVVVAMIMLMVLLATENTVLFLSSVIGGYKFEALSMERFTEDLGKM